MIEDVALFCFDLGFGGVIWDTVSLCSPGWPRTHYADWAALELTEIWQPLPPKCCNERCGHMCADTGVPMRVEVRGPPHVSSFRRHLPLFSGDNLSSLACALPLGWAGQPAILLSVSLPSAEITVLMTKLSFFFS